MLQNIATDILLHHQLRGINRLLYSAPFWQSGLFKRPRCQCGRKLFWSETIQDHQGEEILKGLRHEGFVQWLDTPLYIKR